MLQCSYGYYFISKSTDYKKTKFFNAAKISVVLVCDIVYFGELLWIFNSVHEKALPDLSKIIAIALGIANILTAAGFYTSRRLVKKDLRQKINKFGCKLFLVDGALLIVILMFLKGITCIYVAILGDIILMIALLIYSYHIYKKQTTKNI